MKFSYPDLNAIPHAGLRFYETPKGKYYPSITTVLSKTTPKEKLESLQNWRDSVGHEEADKISKLATDRGTAVHLLAERYLKKEDLLQENDFSEEEVKMFNGLKLKLNKISEVWGQEVALYSDLLEVAGRCDAIGVYNGVPSIIDFKTSSKIKSDSDIYDYKLQLCAYAVMHNEMFGTDINQGVVLMTSAGGFPQEFIVKLTDYVEALAVRTEEFYEQITEEV